MSEVLSAEEMAALNRALARKTGGRLRVGPRPISVAQGIAVWNCVAAFSGDIVDETASAGCDLTRLLATGTTLAVAASLAGCATLGGNVKGDFACRAPDGMCAPTTTIDDAALAMIGGEAAATPAGPYNAPASAPRMSETVAAEPVRLNEKVLRIVFPAHIDATGRFREASAIHAVVESGQWMAAGQVQAVPVRTSAGQPAIAMGEQLAMVKPQRSLGELAALAPEVRFPDPVAAIDAENATEEADAAARVQAPIDKPAIALAAKPLTRRAEAAALSGPVGKVVAPIAIGRGAAIGAGAGAAAVTYSLPPKSTVNPLDAIKAQVAAQLRRAGPVARPTGPQSANAAAATSGTRTEPAAKPANGPSLFPASEVKP
jgi:conjugal transfer pilus assembly protein TraV